MIKIHANGTSRCGIEFYVEGAELSENADGLPLLKFTPGGDSELPQTIGCACSRDVLFQGWNDFIRLENIPAEITDIGTLAGTTDLLQFWRQFPCSGIITVRLQIHVITAATGNLALQYWNGAAWRYVDGLSGPTISLASTGIYRSATVQAEVAVAGDVQFRLATVGGDTTGVTRLGMVSVEWCFTASAGTPPSGGGGGGGGTPGVDPCSPIFEPFNYADIDDFQTSWTLEDTFNIGHWVGINTSTFHGSSGRSIQGQVSGCYPSGILNAKRTITGLQTGETYQVTVWALMSTRAWWDTSTYVYITGGTRGTLAGASNTWGELKAQGVADSNGTIEVNLHRGSSYPACFNFNFYFSDMSIQKLGC